MKRQCVVCEFICFNTATYTTTHGVVCEECFESASGVKSNYEDWLTYNSPKAAKKEIERLEQDVEDFKKAVGWHVEHAKKVQQENAELRFDCEKSNTWCVDIFNDFSESEVQLMAPSIVGAWNRGKQLLNK